MSVMDQDETAAYYLNKGTRWVIKGDEHYPKSEEIRTCTTYESARSC